MAFPAAHIERLGSETGSIDSPDGGIAEIAAACRQQPIVFVRHLMNAEVRSLIPRESSDVREIGRATVQIFSRLTNSPGLSLQVWNDPAIHDSMRSDELRHLLVNGLRDNDITVGRGGADVALGVCVTPAGTFLGATSRDDALADWPGGRVGLAHYPEIISRAALKLEELFKLCPVPLRPGGEALDLGASPGGWTQVVRRAGLRVWAIDPADLDPRLASDSDVHHIRTTAAQYLSGTNREFDLILNDMRMTAQLSAELMVEAATHLRPAGAAIMTIKLAPRDPIETVRDALQTLRRTYTILFARQLFHNRNEVTVVARHD